MPELVNHVTERGRDAPWHAKTKEEALEALGASEDGLTRADAADRLNKHGPNQLPQRKQASLAAIFLRQFRDPLIYILLLAAVVSAVIESLDDAAFIMAVLLVNSILGTLQEWKAESSAGALEQVMKKSARVLRGGERREIPRQEVVPGDIVLLESGDSVPADLRLLTTSSLQVDESLLTGESTPVQKDEDATLDSATPLGDRTNLAFAGSSIVSGRANAVVCATGSATEIGRIAQSLTEEAEDPPLVIKLRRFTKDIAIAVAVAVVVLAIGQAIRGAEPAEIFFLAVALAVAAIPEALPVAVTVALSVSTSRMAKRNVIVRRLPAVEGLGSCTLIATDKTGTLTQNKLAVRRLLLPGHGEVEIGKEMPEPQRQAAESLALTGALCNEAQLTADGATGDPVDVAFLVLAEKLGITVREAERTHPRIGWIPFESELKYSASFNRHDDGVFVHAKGALEVILPMCSSLDAEGMRKQHDRLAERGYRVLAAASGKVDERSATEADETALQGLEFLGLAGLIDPVRPEVPDAVERCRRARVQVRMVTGDHPATALAIARDIGIADEHSRAVIGVELRNAGSDRAFDDAVEHAPVYARVEPAQKTSIVSSLQKRGHFVAVTGDGVNDAPALRAAHIGVAMGEGGTDVARGAADLILTDDNFASIVNGIEEGRIAYDNVRKVTWALISAGLAEILLFLLAFLANTPMPLAAVQLLWLNVVTNGIQNIALAFEKGEPGVIDRPPRPTDEPIFNRSMIVQTALAGAWMGFVGFGAFYWMLNSLGWSAEAASNALLLLMVLFENTQVLNCRSELRSLFRIPVSANPWLFVSVIGAQALHIAAMYIPWLRDTLEIQPVSLEVWLTLLALSVSLVAVVEAYKLVRRRSDISDISPAARD